MRGLSSFGGVVFHDVPEQSNVKKQFWGATEKASWHLACHDGDDTSHGVQAVAVKGQDSAPVVFHELAPDPHIWPSGVEPTRKGEDG